MKLSEKVDVLLAEAEALASSGEIERRQEAERQARWGQVIDRWLDLAASAVELMNDAEGERVAEAMERCGNAASPYNPWLRDLAEGRCRLPELSAETMRNLLLAWLHPNADFSLACVCTACGIEYPHTRQPNLSSMMLPPAGQGLPMNPDLFAACPHCGGPAHGDGMMWAHRIHERDYSWMAQNGQPPSPA